MNKLPRITEIIKIEPFKITCRWTTGEILVVDFDVLMPDLEKSNPFFSELKTFTNFKNIVIQDGTLHWFSVLVAFTGLDGNSDKQALAIDPDVLYQKSKPISDYILIQKNTKNNIIEVQ